MENEIDIKESDPIAESEGSSAAVLEGNELSSAQLNPDGNTKFDGEFGNETKEDAIPQEIVAPRAEIVKEATDIHPTDCQTVSNIYTSNILKEIEAYVGDKSFESATKTEAVIIESVIQLVPAINESAINPAAVQSAETTESNDDAFLVRDTDVFDTHTETGDIKSQGQLLDTTTPGNELGKQAVPVEIDARAEPSNDKVTMPDAKEIEVMDIIQINAEDNDDEVQLVNDKPINESSKESQRAIKRNIPKTQTPLTTNGLGLLSQYGTDSEEMDSSDSETASVIEVPTTANKKSYRSRVIEIHSDSSETISSDSESETESEYLTKITKVINKRIAANDDENDDEDEDDEDNEGEGKGTKKPGRRQPPRVRGEMLLDDLPPIQDLQISVPAEECIEFGRVHSIVDQLLLVSALPNAILLDLETVIFLEQGKRVLGKVFDVLGQVADPLYCVRFNTNQHIHEKGINIGDIVYVAPKTEYTQYVILSSLIKLRGSDASWENDIEPPPRYLDYSDDEEEREARQKLRKLRRQGIKEEEGNDNDDDGDSDGKDKDATKRSRLQPNSTGFRETQPRHEHPGGSMRNYNSGSRQRRPERFGPRPYTPRSNHPRHNTSSWHSHYNPQYQSRPPTHSYHSPYRGPYPYQQHPLYQAPPPGSPQYNPYVHPPMFAAPPPANMYVPNPFAFQPPTLSPPIKMEQPPPQTQSRSPTQSIAEPVPPGAE